MPNFPIYLLIHNFRTYASTFWGTSSILIALTSLGAFFLLPFPSFLSLSLF